MARTSSKKPARKTAPAKGRRDRRTQESGTALAGYAHDVRTALTGILALSELLASSDFGERERQWAHTIKSSAEHLVALSTSIIETAKAESGTLTLAAAAFDPRRLIEDLAELLSARAQTKGLSAEVNIANDLPQVVVGDVVRLRAALENVIDNAVKFTEQGVVRFDARAEGASRRRIRLVFDVTDSGIGLTPAEIKHLFRPFQQPNAAVAQRFGGAGLGLALVKRLAKLMDGDVTVTSRAGRGATFRFSVVLPLAAAEPAARGERPRKDKAARSLAILCAEHNPYGRVILNTILGELGHRADFVGSGEEAVAAVARGYDAVLMDVGLAGTNGAHTVGRIRALPGEAARTPIIALSGHPDADDERVARAAGMDFFVRKPVSPMELAAALAAAVAK
jgi:CheY-like chemotaxis protein/nitrogen-specific signal transduction histidine kinase